MAPHDAKFIVVDRCVTPLEVCRDYAASRGLELETHAIDLANLALDTPADAIVAHSVTRFIPAPDLQQVLTRLRGSLRPKGHFILCTRYRSASASESLADRDERILAALRAALAAGSIDLPESQSDFEKRLRNDSRSLTGRTNLPETPEAAATVLCSAGFTIDRIIRTEVSENDSRRTARQARFGSIIHARR
jgi:hypothetical protein